MASLVTYQNGLRRIEFSLNPGGRRRVLRLGRVNAKTARSVLAKVENLITDKLTHRAHDAELSSWLASLDEKLLSRLRSVGLADGVGVTQTTLGEFLGRVMATLAVKPSTLTFYGHTARNLTAYFATTRPVVAIKPADADAWRRWLVDHEGLSAATVGRRVVAARTFWRRAVRWQLAADNPFDDVRGATQTNDSRKHFVPIEVIETIIDASPDVEWKLLVALARFGGLRTPSESLGLTWQDVDWQRGTLRVRSPKTAHYPGHAERLVPLFPALRRLLLDAYAAAPVGAEFVIRRYRDTAVNLRTQFQRLIRGAGYTPWPRLWQNLRASRESELLREYDLATVCRWIGNSPAVAARHYCMSGDLNSDFRRAAGLDLEAQQKAQQSVPDRRCQGLNIKPAPHTSNDVSATPDNLCHSQTSGAEIKGWAREDSNLRPHRYQRCALTN